ncbi:MAG: hypothetical protein H7Z42_16605 [Roseiflexaceae bacterium]|nr:hypothetical protein [Roseiflexaceae bacterium]
MVDLHIKGLIEDVIDSPLKLQLLLHFCEYRGGPTTAPQIAQRMYHDMWSTREALCELAQDGVLIESACPDEPTYSYCPRSELLEPILRLYQIYNEPIEREDVQQLVRDASRYASFRRTPASSFEHAGHDSAF